MSENQKKILANQIKADLQKDLERTKKEGTIGLTYINRPWCGCDIPSGEEGYIVLVDSRLPENKDKRDLIAPSELEKEDYDEIVSLIKQVQTTAKEANDQKRQEVETKIDQKLSSNPKTFLYKGVVGSDDDEGGNYYFQGIENGQKFHLLFPQNHPAANSLFSKKNSNSKKHGIYYLIEGAENIPLKKHVNGYGNFEKTLKLTDQITIIPVDNSAYLETLQSNKVSMEKYLAKIQTDESRHPEEITGTKNRIKELDEEIQEENNWLAQNGNKLPTPLENKDKIPNSLPKINNKTLLSYFQKNDIKSIELEEEKLIFERNDNSTFTKFLTNFYELKGIDKLLQSKDNNKITRQELELSNSSDTTPTTKSQGNNALWISCGVGGGILIIMLIVGLLLKRKKRTKKY